MIRIQHDGGLTGTLEIEVIRKGANGKRTAKETFTLHKGGALDFVLGPKDGLAVKVAK